MIGVVGETPLPVGRWVMTCGRVTSNSCAVLNVLLNDVRALPDMSVMPFVAITVIVRSSGRAIVRKTMRLSVERVMLGDSRDAPANSTIVLALTVFGLTDSENVNVTVAYGPTSVAPLVGVTLCTDGPAVSGTLAVVNVASWLGSRSPARSRMVEL